MLAPSTTVSAFSFVMFANTILGQGNASTCAPGQLHATTGINETYRRSHCGLVSSTPTQVQRRHRRQGDQHIRLGQLDVNTVTGKCFCRIVLSRGVLTLRI